MPDIRAERVADNILNGCYSRSESTLVITTDHGTQLEATLMVFSLRQKMMKPNVSVILEKLQDFLRLQDTGIVMKFSKCQFLKTEGDFLGQSCGISLDHLAIFPIYMFNEHVPGKYNIITDAPSRIDELHLQTAIYYAGIAKTHTGNGHGVKSHSNFP
ncbi:hypothetical protein TNCV_4516651 [Trichonephila clavipes]|nr:hypothetical protein TNCV_4516651 [Trichonephila clavipes]